MISSRSKKPHLLAKLYNRELCAQFIKGKRAAYDPPKQLFSNVPNRLIFPLQQAMPDLEGDILMGATKCGRFLLTYSFFNIGLEFFPSYRYQLNFWSFVPYRAAKLVATVQLFKMDCFSHFNIYDLLTISIVQWPNVPDRIVVYGKCPRVNNYEEICDYNVCVTVTALPSLDCPDCINLKKNIVEADADKLEVRCRKHGLTFHSSFSLPLSFEFDPVLCTSIDNHVIVNIGSMVHAIEFSDSNSHPSSYTVEEYLINDEDPPALPEKKTDIIYIRNAPLVNRLSYSFLTDNSFMIIISDSWIPKILTLLVKWVKLGHQIEIKELPSYLKYAIQKNSKVLKKLNVSNDSVSGIVLTSTNVQEIAFSHYTPSRPRWFSSDKTRRAHTRQNQPPDKVYEFAEDGSEVECKYNSFRRWCLASKVYDFRSFEEEHCRENIKPIIPSRLTRHYTRSVKEKAREVTIGRFVSGLSRDSRERKRKRKLSQKMTTDHSCWMGPHFELADEVAQVMQWGFGHQPLEWYDVKTFVKHFTEAPVVDPSSEESSQELRTSSDENSEIFDEVEMCLPVTAVCANNAKLVKVPGSVKSLNCWNATVHETVLDVETVCNNAVEKVCQAENFIFKRLKDWDSEILQVCPLTYDILMIFHTTFAADVITAKKRIFSEIDKETSSYVNGLSSSKQYDCSLLVIWNPLSQSCYLEGYSGLTEVGVGKGGQCCSSMSSSTREANRLRLNAIKGFGVPCPHQPRSFSHLAHSASCVSAQIIVDQDNLIGFKKH